MGLITEDGKTGKTSDGLELGLGRPTRRERVEDEPAPYSSEITLGMRSMLAIFFGLVLVCGVFFGLGYSVGRNGGLRPAQDETAASPAVGDSSLKKPSATDQGLTPVPAPAGATNGGQSNTAQNSNAMTETDLGSKPVSDESTKPAETPAPAVQPAAATTQPAATKPAPQPAAQKPALTPAPAPAAKANGSFSDPYRPVTPQPAAQSSAQNSASPAPGGFMVQIAAVRQPQDANILASALQQHGFHAVVRHEAQDQLLHVQLGPFATRAQAFDMRSKLLADGYNAVVK